MLCSSYFSGNIILCGNAAQRAVRWSRESPLFSISMHIPMQFPGSSTIKETKNKIDHFYSRKSSFKHIPLLNFSDSCKHVRMDGSETKRRRLTEALSRWSGKEILRFERDRDAASEPTDRTSKKQVEKALKPIQNFLEQLNVCAKDGSNVFFWTCNLEKYFNFLGQESPQFLGSWTLGTKSIKLTLYMDECTGGNIVAPQSSKKTCFFYIFVDETKYQHIPCLWLPLAMIPSKDVSVVSGGMSAVTKVVLKHLHSQLERGLIISGKRYDVELQAYVGDYDSIARIYMSKGASGLRPCLCCANIVAKWSDLPNLDSFFLHVSSPDVESFQPIRSVELYEAFDDFLASSQNVSKAALKEHEKQLGYSLHPHSLLVDPARTILPLEMLTFDSCHMYFSNGVAAEEINLMIHQLQEKAGVTLQQLRRSVQEVNWHCHSTDFNAPSSRSFLFADAMFDGSFYRGSASKVWYVLPLVHYYSATLAADALGDSMASFSALLKVPAHGSCLYSFGFCSNEFFLL